MKSASRKPQPKRKYFKSRGFSRLFCFSWEQRKLEDYLTVSTEKNTGNIYGRSDVLSVSGDYGIVNQIEFQGRSFAGASVSNYGVVQTGDVVYTKSPLNSNPYGIIKTNKGKPGIVSTLYAVYHPKDNAFPDFIQVYFEQHARMNNYMHPLVNKGAKNDMKVSAENALKGTVCFPSRVEQESISAFFSVLDNLITLHQRDSIMRFFGAWDNANAWEQRKFEDLYDYASEGGTPDTNNPAFYEGGKIPFVKIEDTVEKYIDSPKSYITEEGMNHSSAWLIPKGNVIFTNGATVGNVAINRLPVTTKQGILGIIPSKKVTSEFLFYLLSSTEFQREVRSRMATGTFATIILKSLNEIPVCFPSNTNEQESIITILSRLDNLITLHQRERKNRLFGGKNVKQYNFSRLVLQLLRAMDSRLQRRGSSQGDYG